MIRSAIVTCPKCNTRILPKQDGTCPSCGALLSSKESDAGQRVDSTGNAARSRDVIPSRTQKAPKKGARNDGWQTRGPDDSRKPRIRLAIEDVVWPYTFAEVGVGDLLFVGCDVYFVCYSPMVTQSSGVWSVFGGLIGGLAASSQDKASLDSARQAAVDGRKRYYGLSLDERVEQVYKSIVIRNPASVAYDTKAFSITCTSSTGEKTTFFVPRMTKAALAILAEFPEGEDSLYPQEDPYGLLVWSSSPKALTELLVQGQADAAVLEDVASNQLYMVSFYQQVRRMPPEQQGVLVENLRHTPVRFRASLSLIVADTQNVDTHTRKNTAAIGRILGLILVVISLAFLSTKNYFGLAGLALLGLACLVYIPYYANRTAHGQERLMQAVLDAVSRGR